MSNATLTEITHAETMQRFPQAYARLVADQDRPEACTFFLSDDGGPLNVDSPEGPGCWDPESGEWDWF